VINPIAKNVLDYWFGSRPINPSAASARGNFWFGADKDADYDIERRFGKLVSAARAGSLDSWRTDPENCLALIILLDQFPRNLYRGQAGAFASDEQALKLSRDMVKRGLLAQLDYPERAFALMPFQHVESKQGQRESVELFQEQADSAPEDWKKIMQGYADFADQHCQIVERFGRFPHRNVVLGRENSVEEAEYLSDGGSRFGQ
jgi:uncharacterized protein (DUF924 family)